MSPHLNDSPIFFNTLQQHELINCNNFSNILPSLSNTDQFYQSEYLNDRSSIQYNNYCNTAANLTDSTMWPTQNHYNIALHSTN